MAGREQALVQVIHAFIAAGARFFEVPFGQADRGDRPELNFRWSATMPSEQITPVIGINDRTIKDAYPCALAEERFAHHELKFVLAQWLVLVLNFPTVAL